MLSEGLVSLFFSIDSKTVFFCLFFCLEFLIIRFVISTFIIFHLMGCGSAGLGFVCFVTELGFFSKHLFTLQHVPLQIMYIVLTIMTE